MGLLNAILQGMQASGGNSGVGRSTNRIAGKPLGNLENLAMGRLRNQWAQGGAPLQINMRDMARKMPSSASVGVTSLWDLLQRHAQRTGDESRNGSPGPIIRPFTPGGGTGSNPGWGDVIRSIIQKKIITR